MSLDISGLRGFVAVAELGSFNRAAHFLNLSQPALTRRIQNLEEVLGIKLFERTTRRVALSAIGQDFLPRARRLLDEFDSSLLSVRTIAKRSGGQVNIACIPTVALHLLPEIIKAFHRECPDIRVRVIEEDFDVILQYVIDGKADIGINPMATPEPDIEFEALLKEPYLLACRKDHPLAKKKEVDWRDLKPHRFIIVGRLGGNRLLLDLGQSRVTGISNVSNLPQWFYEVQRQATSLGFVEAGLGVAALPRMAIPQSSKTLVSRPLVNPVLSRTIGIIRRRHVPLSPVAEKFYEAIKAAWSPKWGTVA